jgi:hypothetical protein
VIDTIRTWTTITEQTLAAQHQLARTLAGVATRQVDTAVSTVSTTVEAVETTVGDRVRRVEDLIEAAEAGQERVQERPQQPQVPTADTPKGESPRQDRRPDGRTYEERSVEELRERAGELQIEGRSSMSKDELIAALRGHRQRRSAKKDAPKSQPPNMGVRAASASLMTKPLSGGGNPVQREASRTAECCTSRSDQKTTPTP